MYAFDEIKKADSEIADAIQAEMERQNSHLELIASENWVSKAVMAAMGSPLTNKYAEGYPGKRYYGGCQCVDVVEDLARERAKKLFGCDYANVQPHSGAQANLAVFFAMLEPGDKVMGMNLDPVSYTHLDVYKRQVELGILTTERGADGKIHITLDVASECIQKRVVKYDKTGDNHYDTISAFIKSMRGSDPDAAVYYLCLLYTS